MTTVAEPTPTAPVPSPSAPAPPRRSGSRRVVIAAAVVLGALAFLVSKGLGDATVFFKTADEAVADKASLGDRRFRVEGLVTPPVERSGDEVRFSIVSAGVCVPVRHVGDPPELFKPGIPVVLEGRWRGDVYASDRILVKHTSEYREKNSARLDRAAADQPVATCNG
jgi:cytochrome c-type biogenesis protein CcmE